MRRLTLYLLPAAALAQAFAPLLPEERHGLRFATPALTWDEALPLGNGMLGALVWGDGRPLRISLDRADLWDLREVPEFRGPDYRFSVMQQWHQQGRVKDLLRVYEEPYGRAAPTKIPAGRIELTLPQGALFDETALHLAAATGTVRWKSGAAMAIFIHATEPVGMAKFAGLVPPLKLVPPAFKGDRPPGAPQPGIRSGDLSLLGYPAPAETQGAAGQGFTQEGAEGFRFAVFVGWRGSLLAWSVSSSREGADPLARARQRVEAALARGWDRTIATHKQWWANYWRQSGLRVPHAAIERQWYLETYKFGAATRRGAPPITLQAIWTADDGKLPPWKGDYHHDLNTQLSYWPSYSGNHLEEQLAYLDWLWKTRDTGFDWTQRFFGLPGLNVPMTADLHGRQIGGWRQYTHSATTAAWLAHHFWLHWRYSGDREFLRIRAYPYLRDAATFVEAFTATRDARGLRTHPLSSSPEINDNKPAAWFDTVTNYDLALDRWLMHAASELAAELGLKDEAARWSRVEQEFPPFALAEDGRLLIAPGQPLSASHRHFSHLMAIHPLGLIDWDQGEPAQRTIRAALSELERLGPDLWCGYSYAWLASLAARGRDGDRAAHALEVFAKAFTTRNSFHVNGDQTKSGYSKFTYRPFTLEGNFAMAAGLQEMLLQSHSGVIRIFPAVPESWGDVEFRTLRAEGAVLVSARRIGGKVAGVQVTAEKGGVFRIASPATGEILTLRLKPGERRDLR